MVPFLLRRAGYTALLVALVVLLTFLLLEAAPGDASLHFVDPDLPPHQAALMRELWGLDQPLLQRALTTLGNLATGRLGDSLIQARPVADLLREAMPPTLLLSGLALLLGFGLGIPLGAWQAARAGTLREGMVGLCLLALFAMPELWLGILLMLAFSGGLGLLPSSGWVAWNHGALPPAGQVLDHLRHLVLPCLTLTLPSLAWVARHQRASLRAVLGADFVRTARALHLPAQRVLLRHALPASLLPVLNLAGVSLPALISGSVVVESVFAWPGMGRLMVQAILDRDTPVVVACFLLYAVAVALGSLLADLLAAALDPRLRDRGAR